MNKEEFLKRLEQLLSDISEEERADALAFYRSYFEDAGIGNEASILEELESPEKVAEVIKKDLGVSETADAETPEEDVRSEKNETHTEGTSGDGQTVYMEAVLTGQVIMSRRILLIPAELMAVRIRPARSI